MTNASEKPNLGDERDPKGETTIGRREVLSGVATTATMALGGCTIGGKLSDGPHLRIGTLQPPVTLDPITAKYVGSVQAIGTIFDGLYTYNDGSNLVPQIAAGPPSFEGAEAVLVELDEGSTFQNDRPVAATDVKYSFEAPVMEDTPAKDEVSMIEAVEIVDQRTIRFELKHPSPTIEHALTRPIVPKSVREANRETFASEPVGAGPFKVASFSEEKKAKLVRWNDYWREPKPAISTITFIYVESPITQMMGLRTNRTDMIEPVSPQLSTRIRDVTDATIAQRDGYRMYYIGFNINEGPTTDQIVREAISFCIDLDEVVADFIEPIGRRQYGPIPTQVAKTWQLPTEAWKQIANEKDTEKARRLFEKAGAGSGQFTILTSKDPKWKEIGEALAGGLRDAGHGALVESTSWKKYLEKYVSGSEHDYSVFVGERAGTGDPDSFLYPLVHENMQGLTNGIFYNEERTMNQILNARQTTNRAKRRERYAAAIRTLLEERVILPICSFKNSYAHKPSIRGFRVHPIAQLNPRIVSPNRVVTVSNHG